jgi:hypothetical protein
MMRREAGQAAVEVVAAVPLLLAVGLLAWQAVALLDASMDATAAARRDALTARGRPGATVTVTREVGVPGFLPGVGPGRVRASVAVRSAR